MPDPDGPVKREPRAELRQAASATREMFVALTDQGFTEAQALQIVAAMMTTNRSQGS